MDQADQANQANDYHPQLLQNTSKKIILEDDVIIIKNRNNTGYKIKGSHVIDLATGELLPRKIIMEYKPIIEYLQTKAA